MLRQQILPIVIGSDIRPPQHQGMQPGLENLMYPVPISDNAEYIGSGKLKGKIAIITGDDSGIGRAVAIGFAKEGADIAIVFTPREREDAELTRETVEFYGGHVLFVEGDLREPGFSREVINETIENFGKIDVLVLNQGVQFPQESILNITDEQKIHIEPTSSLAFT